MSVEEDDDSAVTYKVLKLLKYPFIYNNFYTFLFQKITLSKCISFRHLAAVLEKEKTVKPTKTPYFA